MINTLRNFTNGSLFYAASALLTRLHIKFDSETAEPINFENLYEQPIPKYLAEALACVDKTYFIGIVNDGSLQGAPSGDTLSSVAETMKHEGKYDGMFVFACDVHSSANLTRSAASALTRAFNRIASANPVILILRQGQYISLATCERMNYTQEWRNGLGEKLGKVCILRNVNCLAPHRGHVDILESLGDKAYPTFEELYKHWMEVFSSELLTRKFYNELSDWYAWAVMVAKFPNDLRTTEDDAKYNHESCIRLITRIIFVWFLKQKHLIPEEFFDEKYIRENLIESFDPHDRQSLLYNADESKYYRLILQNLFFAMLNCPIVAEGKTTPNNRRFIRESFQGKNPDYGINNIMRYRKEFMEGGADKFLKFANSCIPFLNGGLFDCLDNKDSLLFFDGFSEEKRSLEQLSLPDYLFFGDEVGKGIDLSQWYDDKKKKNVSARGIIDILKRYSFTIEENTPYDQEVSLDPELLGKVFENLLAAYNPETKQSARKQTGSFYTPREIVQYMVDESLVAHLKRMCGDEMEPQYRQLLNYAADEVSLTEDQRKSIMHALYNCRVLDPACGSGAFPMGILQQMVHVLKRIDPSNKMWEEMIVDLAIEEARKELEKVASGNQAEMAKIEENRKARLDDIESAFNQSINDPDYARKLYLIENCIYGVDIQPIATQISKLRFFISLVVDQKPTSVAKDNFGIRPLPNLEAKFVTANTLIPLDRTQNLFTTTEDIKYYEGLLHDINHRIFLAKKNTVKKELKQQMYSVRAALAQTMENMGQIGPNGYSQLTSWDMFNQNASASFFDPEWMFGVKDGFDIVIGNPPYVLLQTLNDKKIELEYKKYEVASYKIDLFHLFYERGITVLTNTGVLAYITPNTFLTNKYIKPLRSYILKKCSVQKLVLHDKVFDNASVDNATIFLTKSKRIDNSIDIVYCTNLIFEYSHSIKQRFWEQDPEKSFNVKQCSGFSYNNTSPLSSICSSYFGIQAYDKKTSTCKEKKNDEWLPIIDGADIHPYQYSEAINFFHYKEDLIKSGGQYKYYCNERIVIRQIGNTPVVGLCKGGILGSNTLYNINIVNTSFRLKYIYGVLNSKVIKHYWKTKNSDNKALFPKIKGYQLKEIPIPQCSNKSQLQVENLVNCIMDNNQNTNTLIEIEHVIYHLYNLTYDEVLVIDPETPITREEYDNFKID